MKKQRYYLDTSAWGGFFDLEFEAGSKLLYEMVKNGEIYCLYSDIVSEELKFAPEDVRSFFEKIPDGQKEKIAITPEIRRLSEAYINESVVGGTSSDDCLHIASATVHNADKLISWNFKHIVNVKRIKGYNDINVKFGYTKLEICSPKEVKAL